MNKKARLERLVAAAKNSLASASATLVPRNPEFPITEVQLIQQQSSIKQAELKLRDAEKKLADFIATQTLTPATDDPVAAAIARAQAKLTQSPDEKLRANLESLQTRLAKAQEKAEQAKAENSPTAEALQQGVDKMQQKIIDTKAELDAFLASKPVGTNTAKEKNAAAMAIEKAKAKAAAQATMSDEEKRKEQIQSLQMRLQKAKERLAKAEAENDANVEVFKTAMNKLDEKLKELNI